MQEIADFCNDVANVEDAFAREGAAVSPSFLSDALWAIGEFADGTNSSALEEFRADHPSMRASS